MRNVHPDLVAALNVNGCQPFYAVEYLIDDAGGARWNQPGYSGNRAIRLWTGLGDRVIGGNTYTGSGSLLSISGLKETAELRANGASITLSGIDPSIIALAIGEPYQGRRVNVYLGETSVSQVVRAFAGLADTMPIKQGAESVTISLAIEHKVVALQKANIRRYTSANHRLRYPNDSAFDFVSSLQDKEVVWGPRNN